MEVHKQHRRLVAADEYSAVVEAQPRSVGLRNNPGCYQYSHSSLDLKASREEPQFEAADTGSHHSTAEVRCTAQGLDLAEIVQRPSQCRGKERTQRDDGDEP